MDNDDAARILDAIGETELAALESGDPEYRLKYNQELDAAFERDHIEQVSQEARQMMKEFEKEHEIYMKDHGTMVRRIIQACANEDVEFLQKSDAEDEIWRHVDSENSELLSNALHSGNIILIELLWDNLMGNMLLSEEIENELENARKLGRADVVEFLTEKLEEAKEAEEY